MNWYIADMHLGHTNVLRFDNRPFENIEVMNDVLVENWNHKVVENDDIWIVGDFCYRSGNDPSYFLRQLKGKKHLIVGNHDRATLNSKNALKHFVSIERIDYVKDSNKDVVMCHYPIAEWHGSRHGAIHIYGHIHSRVEDETFKYMSQIENALNAGCMINNYEPVNLLELIDNNRRFQQTVEEKKNLPSI